MAEFMGFLFLLVLIGLFALFAVPVGLLFIWAVRKTTAPRRPSTWRERAAQPSRRIPR
ncbi:hypothetical protein [Alicyclobacillus sp. ALC3]|uniref:hypothetical protein n=1 Tax=Alicyclobacillus sp. ALC3 TaxID=2796143 RepID=UPI002378FB9E|nr:hypothetical protein [Alicyclobacillus sp. ALC3]WDL99188.1 hypothetical protein JC200_11405 [Alicyclobacillus sp. ALC3]